MIINLWHFTSSILLYQINFWQKFKTFIVCWTSLHPCNLHYHSNPVTKWINTQYKSVSFLVEKSSVYPFTNNPCPNVERTAECVLISFTFVLTLQSVPLWSDSACNHLKRRDVIDSSISVCTWILTGWLIDGHAS